MLASGHHIRIGNIDLMLDEEQEEHYVHGYDSVQGQVSDAGHPGSENIHPELKVWIRDDWSGGEGDKFYDEGHPDLYYQSEDANVRLIGSIRKGPTITGTTLS